MSSALVLSAFTAATTFKSIALASSAVPDWPPCCANAVGESVRTAADAVVIMNVRIMDSSLSGHALTGSVSLCGTMLIDDVRRDKDPVLGMCLPTACALQYKWTSARPG